MVLASPKHMYTRGNAVPACVYMYKQDSCYNVTQQKAAYVGLARTVYIRIYTPYIW